MPSADAFPGEPFRHIGERSRFDGGFFRVVTGTFVAPNGFTFEREIVRHPGAVCAVPLEDDRRHVVMIRQYRAAIDRVVLELPAGKRDVESEDPAACIARELVEEIGRQAGTLEEIGRFFNSPGFSDEETLCYLAEGLIECEREAHGVEEENITLESVDLSDIEKLVAAGELADAKSIIGLFLARSFLSGDLPSVPAGGGERR